MPSPLSHPPRFDIIRRIALLAALVPLPGAARAADADGTTLTVEAGKHDRHNEPVCVPLQVPKVFADVKALYLMPEKGEPILAQLTGPGLFTTAAPQKDKVLREFHFILTTLKA